MAKLVKIELYVSDLNSDFNIDNLKSVLEQKLYEDYIVKSVKELDVTEYIDNVGNNYGWNTTDDEEARLEIDKYWRVTQGSPR